MSLESTPMLTLPHVQGFDICIPRSGYIFIPVSVRWFPVRSMLVSMVGEMSIPDISSVISGIFYFGTNPLGSLVFSTPLLDWEMYSLNVFPLFICLEAPLRTNEYGLGLEEINAPLYCHHCCPTRKQETMVLAAIMVSIFVPNI